MSIYNTCYRKEKYLTQSLNEMLSFWTVYNVIRSSSNLTFKTIQLMNQNKIKVKLKIEIKYCSSLIIITVTDVLAAFLLNEFQCRLLLYILLRLLWACVLCNHSPYVLVHTKCLPSSLSWSIVENFIPLWFANWSPIKDKCINAYSS